MKQTKTCGSGSPVTPAEQVGQAAMSAIAQKDAEIESLRQQLTSAQAANVRLLVRATEVLKTIQAQATMSDYGTWPLEKQVLAELLSICQTRPDTAALSALIAKAGEAMQIKAENIATHYGQRRVREAIYNLPAITLKEAQT